MGELVACISVCLLGSCDYALFLGIIKEEQLTDPSIHNFPLWLPRKQSQKKHESPVKGNKEMTLGHQVNKAQCTSLPKRTLRCIKGTNTCM